MTRSIRAWAPDAQRVEVVDGDRRTLMTADGGGWHSAPASAAGHDGRYLLSVDGGDPIPDPRSASQPDGVHGPSQLVDHSAFEWHDDDWRGAALRDAVIYELHVGTFTDAGTFDAVIEKLPHLTALGVTAVELMPVGAFPGARGWGYDGVDLYSPHPAYGGPEGLKRLVDACHRAGVAVLLDVVYNHLGPDGNYLGAFGPYFTDVYQTPWGTAMNFDGPGCDEVRRFFVDNALGWLRDYHCDGLRLDAVHAIIDTSAVHFLEQLSTAISRLRVESGRDIWLIAESDLNDPRLLRPCGAGGLGFDAQWSDDFHHALHSVLTGERNGYYADFGRLEHLATALRQAFVYAGRYSGFRQRTYGRHPDGLNGSAFLGYIQDHDQVGNRARGERISRLVSPGLCKVAAALVLLSPFTPMLFAGEEWAASTPFLYFTDHQDRELGRSVTRGRRREFASFGWPADDVPDPQAPATFEASRLHWEEVTEPAHAEMLDWYRQLLRFRAAEPGLRDGRLEEVQVAYDETGRWLVVTRGSVVSCCNFGAVPATVITDGAVVLASDSAVAVSAGRLVLPPESVAILRRD